ncbi:MAG: T9SS type A sorting domain-containing protein [Candidatus Paceibacterota bacterium]
MKNLFNFLVLFLLVACSLFAQWTDLEKRLSGPTLTAINTAYPGIGNEALFGGNFSGTADGTVLSQRVIKYNSLTGTFSSVTGLSVGDIIKGFFVGPDGLMRAYGKFTSAGEYFGICKFNSTNNNISFEMVFQFTGPNASSQQIDAGYSANGKVLLYGANFSEMNGVTLSGANSVALINSGTVTNQLGLVPTVATGTPSIKNFRHNGSNWIILGNFNNLGTTATTGVGLWNETSVIQTTGIPSNGFAWDVENGILGHTTGPMALSGSTGSSYGSYPLNSQDVTHFMSEPWICGTKLSSGSTGRIAAYQGGVWVNKEGTLINPPQRSTSAGTMYGMVSFPNCILVYGNFSPPVSHCTFMAKLCSTPLPVKISSFEGINTIQGNELYWQTKSEINNNYFEIESLVDGKEFKKIGLVEGKNSPSDYSFVDENPKEKNYYRLKQIDFDGKFQYSKVIVLKKEDSFEENVYPNPFTDVINIETKETDISILDESGKIIQGFTNLNDSNHPTIIDLSHLKNGTYVVKTGSNLKRIIKIE